MKKGPAGPLRLVKDSVCMIYSGAYDSVIGWLGAVREGDIMELFLIPAAFGFCIVGVLSWNLRAAVTAAVIVGILAPVLLFWRVTAVSYAEVECRNQGKVLKPSIFLECE